MRQERGAAGAQELPIIAIRGNQMAKPRDNRQADLLLARLDQIINMKHPLVLLAEKID